MRINIAIVPDVNVQHIKRCRSFILYQVTDINHVNINSAAKKKTFYLNYFNKLHKYRDKMIS